MKRAAAIAALISMVFAAPASAGTAEGTAAYERGDFAAAHREYMPAARAGDARAQFSLGLLYLRGLGVERDDIVAMQWLRRAAGQGDGDARLLLGELHMQDAPALRDLVKSHVWLSLALSKLRGPKRAAALDLRGRVAARMSGEQLDRAKKMVRE